MILVTGGAGFIGTNFILNWLAQNDESVVNLDKLTYAGNPENIGVQEGYQLVAGDMGDRNLVAELLQTHQPRAVINFAAESHVDRSIYGPDEFIQTNVVGTCNLLGEVTEYWNSLESPQKEIFRFLHVSTDEVYGSLDMGDQPFTEAHTFAPNSPYAASKASSDHFVRAWHHTFGLPVVTTNCSNNYGPYQFPEKLIPLIIMNSLNGKSLPIYGDGMNVRDWLYVTDHCDAIVTVLENGGVGEVYNIGGWNEMTNLEIVNKVCALLDELRPDSAGPYSRLVTFVGDRPGHDLRYAIDAHKIKRELGWTPRETFESGIRKSVEWYLSNMEWTERVSRGDHESWIETNYGERS